MDNAGLLGKITDHQRPDTVASRLRQRRYEFFRNLATSVQRPLKILDVGGTQTIWERIGFADQHDIHITILNIVPVPVDHSNMTAVVGSACSMSQFQDRHTWGAIGKCGRWRTKFAESARATTCRHRTGIFRWNPISCFLCFNFCPFVCERRLSTLSL